MNSDYVAYLALIVSLFSLVVSFLTLYRDRHVVRARADAVVDLQGVCHLLVSVSNSGKRPISITHVLLRPPSHPGMFVNFSPSGSVRLDVGESKGCQINPTGLPVTWSNIEELRRLEVFVDDAVGKRHKATFSGNRTLSSWLRNMGLWRTYEA